MRIFTTLIILCLFLACGNEVDPSKPIVVTHEDAEPIRLEPGESIEISSKDLPWPKSDSEEDETLDTIECSYSKSKGGKRRPITDVENLPGEHKYSLLFPELMIFRTEPAYFIICSADGFESWKDKKIGSGYYKLNRYEFLMLPEIP